MSIRKKGNTLPVFPPPESLTQPPAAMSLDLDKVQALVRLVTESGVAEVEVEEKGVRIVVRRSSPSINVQQPGMPYPMMMPMPGMMPQMAAPAQSAGSSEPHGFAMSQAERSAATGTPSSAPAAEAEPGSGANETLVRAPIVGTFYRAPSPDADPFVKEGDTIKLDDTLCIIEAMKLMNEVQSEISGTIKKILVENGEPVEFDQPLFVVTV